MVVLMVALVPVEVDDCARLVLLAHQNTVYYPKHHHLCVLCVLCVGGGV